MSWFDSAVVAMMPLMPRPLMRRLSRPYIAGVRLEDAIELVRQLERERMMATLDLLGEHITRLDAADRARDAYLGLLGEIHRTGVAANISIKLTQLGLTVDRDACRESLDTLVRRARELGCFVRIDMEDSSCTDATLELYRGLRRDGLDNVGVVLQAMLRRTLEDARALAREGANVRLCKGIYVEPPTIAYRDRDEVRRSYLASLEALWDGGCYVALATHDDELIARARERIAARGLERAAYEFQMLLGVRPALRRSLVDSGERLRVYVPFGENWYAYSLRRMRENPQVAGHVARSIVGGLLGRTNGSNS